MTNRESTAIAEPVVGVPSCPVSLCCLVASRGRIDDHETSDIDAAVLEVVDVQLVHSLTQDTDSTHGSVA